MRRSSPVPRCRPSEDGYVSLIAIFLLAILTLALSVAVPAIAKQIQLDRERETMERGMQYRRAIQLYYRKFHAYPPTIDAMIETNNIRFLRKRYIDPMTGKDDWTPILFGQNKTPTAMGFFGEPLGGIGSTGVSTLAGIGPSGGNGSAGASMPGAASAFTSNGGAAAAPTGGASTSDGFGGGSNSSIGITGGAGGSSDGAGSADASGNSSSGFGQGQSGQTFGGAGIIGVSPASARQSIMIYKKKDYYNQWEFTYDPLGDLTLSGDQVLGQTPGGSVVGNGSGPNQTGPPTAPIPSPQGAFSPP